MPDEPRSPTRKGAPASLEKRYALEEETLRHMATCFSYAARSRDLERSADAIAALRTEVARLTAASDAYQEDVRALLLALGLGDHARPDSPHDVLRGEVLPAIERMKVQDGALLSEAWERSLEHVNTMQRAITIMQEDIDRPLFTTRKEKAHEHAG